MEKRLLSYKESLRLSSCCCGHRIKFPSFFLSLRYIHMLGRENRKSICAHNNKKIIATILYNLEAFLHWRVVYCLQPFHTLSYRSDESRFRIFAIQFRNVSIEKEVPPGFEPRSQESEPWVITNYTMEPHFRIKICGGSMYRVYMKKKLNYKKIQKSSSISRT